MNRFETFCRASFLMLAPLLFLNACSDKGDDKAKPPPVTNSPLSPQEANQQRETLYRLVRQMSGCLQGPVTATFLSVAPAVASGVGSALSSATNSASSALSGCANTARNAISLADTLYAYCGGWRCAFGFFQSHASAFANNIAGSLSRAGYPLNSSTLPVYATLGATMLNQFMSSTGGSISLQSLAQNGISALHSLTPR
jgi:hypothetical protein